MADIQSLRFVVLETPYDQWENPIAREMFGRMALLKLNGYRKEYPYGVLPLDATDYVSTHLLICTEEPGGPLKPIAGYKSLTLQRCYIHNLKFPLLNYMSESTAPLHASAVKHILERHQHLGNQLAYNGSWTVDPDIRSDRTFVSQLKELMMGLGVRFCQAYGITTLLGAGAVLNKADKYFRGWGYTPLKGGDGVELPAVSLPAFFDRQVQVIHLDQFNESALENAERAKSLWENRQTLGAPTSDQEAA